MAQGIECLIEDAKAAGLPPVFAAYTALIRAWGQRKQMVSVRQVLTDMQEDGLQPNELHYRAAILAHARNFRPQEAEVFAPHVSLACCLSATYISAADSGAQSLHSDLTYVVEASQYSPWTICLDHMLIQHMTCNIMHNTTIVALSLTPERLAMTREQEQYL